MLFGVAIRKKRNMTVPSVPEETRCALLLAHPGHELVIHGLVHRLHPTVAILTDGSGKTGVSRVDSTTRCMEPAGAKPTSFYGGYTDREIYRALLTRDTGFFVGILEQVADLLVSLEAETVIGDAAEGWNPVHDVWRSIVDEAVGLASSRRGKAIRNFDFLLFAPHPVAALHAASDSITMHLDESAYRRKLEAAEMYAELHGEVDVALHGKTGQLVPVPELSRELDRRLQGLSAESYRTEHLRPVTGPSLPLERRVYELYGEMLVARGRYEEAIRYETHLLPVEMALRQHATRETKGRGACVS